MRLPPGFHLGELVGEKEHLPVAGAGDQGVLGIAAVLDHEARVPHVALAAHAFQVGLPALAVGRIGEHEVELAGREGVVGEGGVLGAAHDVVGGVPFPFEQQVGLADGVGLGVDLLAEQVGGDLSAAFGGELLQHVLGHGQHAPGAAGSVVDQVGAGPDPVGDGQEDELRHQGHGVARGPVLARLLVVLLVEAPDQLLEDRAHAVVVEAGVPDRAVGYVHRDRAQVDVGRGQLFDQGAEGVGAGQPRYLVAELEAFEDVLDVGREPVEPIPEVVLELLGIAAGPQVAEGELRGVVEGLSGDLPKGGVLLDDAGLVEGGLHLQDRLLALLKHRVEPAQHGHGKDHVAVLAAHVQVAQDVVGDAPDVVRDPVEVAVAHVRAAPRRGRWVGAGYRRSAPEVPPGGPDAGRRQGPENDPTALQAKG